MSDSKTGKEKLGDAAKKAEEVGEKLTGAGTLLTAIAAFVKLLTKKS